MNTRKPLLEHTELLQQLLTAKNNYFIYGN